MRRILYTAAAVLIGAPIAAALGFAAYLNTTGNFHPVIAGEAYRSAQPDAAELARWTGQTGIRSVLNLRGASPDAGWYREELGASERLGLTHADFRMSSTTPLSPERRAELLTLIASLPKPVLIHCRSGADRTGLVSALYLAERGAGEEAAEGQISLRYGHVSLPMSQTWAMDQSWEAAEAGFGYAS